MSRRHSRVSLADRQNEALQEFETLKRKYLQYNKAIIKENSQLRVQIEELKGQISQLYAENLALGKSNIALEKELKHERANKRGAERNTIQAADAVAATLIKQIEGLRKSFSKHTTEQPPSPAQELPQSLTRTRPPPSSRQNLLAKAPDFDLIEECDAEDEDVADDDELLTGRARELDSPTRSTTPTEPLPPQEPLSTIPTTVSSRRKPTRRQSGLLGPARVARQVHEDEPMPSEEDAPRSSGEPRKAVEQDITEAVSPGPTSTAQTKKKPRARSSGKGLVDVTNSPPRRDRKAAETQNLMSIVAQASDDAIKSSNKQMEYEPSESPFLVSLPSTHDNPPNSRASESTEGPPGDPESAGGSSRPTRTRKSVNYAEPKLNTKMRKPDEPTLAPYAYATLPTVSPGSNGPALPPAVKSPSSRPIKSLVYPSSLMKATTPKETATGKPSSKSKALEIHRDDVPEEALSARPPSPTSLVSANEVSEADITDESLSDASEDSDEDGDQDGPLRAPKSPRRPTAEVLDEFKCASLSNTSMAKPSKLPTVSKPATARASVGALASLSSQPLSSDFSRSHPASSHPADAMLVDALSAVPQVSRKRKTAPMKYEYFDISDDEGGAEGDEDYIPGGRRKSESLKMRAEGSTSGGKERRRS
ncbi:hypothetical protein FRB99_007555 [Tulasnella sp. 403]|nr:hypothetical protein FRB99_007555 [Tulasnella sp. 403]